MKKLILPLAALLCTSSAASAARPTRAIEDAIDEVRDADRRCKKRALRDLRDAQEELADGAGRRGLRRALRILKDVDDGDCHRAARRAIRDARRALEDRLDDRDEDRDGDRGRDRDRDRDRKRRKSRRLHRGVKQVVFAGGRLFALMRSGSIEVRKRGDWRTFDKGTGTRQIAATERFVYVLKDSGNIWRAHTRGKGKWTKIDKGTGTRQLAAIGGAVFALKDDGRLWRYRNDSEWQKIDNAKGTVQIYVDRSRDVLYALKSNGNVWRYDGDWKKVDNGTGTKQIAAGDGILYVLKDSGTVWNHRRGKWTKIKGMKGARRLYVSGTDVYAQRGDNIEYLADRRDGDWERVYRGDRVKRFIATGDRLYVIDGRALHAVRMHE